MRGPPLVSTTRRGTSASSAALLALTLALSTIGIAHADTVATDDPAEGAAGYLVSALVDGERIQSEFDGDFFDAPGATADTVYALSAVGVASGSIDAATTWLETQAETYSGADGEVWAGASGKLLLVAATTGRDPRQFGGVDLVSKVEGVEVTDADPDDDQDLLGRYRDVSDFGDFSSPLTQALVLLGLHRAEGTDPSPEAVQALLDQQCDDGGFPEAFLVPSAETCSSSVDTTGYAAQALHALGEEAAVSDAVAWLESVQADEGSFGSPEGQNTNSAGLAAVALSIGGGDQGAIDRAREFIARVQDGPDTDTPGAIPFNADERGFVELATAQAVPGLVGVGLADVSAVGASSEVPAFQSEAADPDAPAPETAAPSDAETDDEEQEMPQPSRVDSGVSPSGTPMTTSLLVLAVVLGTALLASVATRRRRHHV